MSGHEAQHLAKCLTEELAQQQAAASRSFGNRANSPEPEQRSRSYECRSPQAKGKGIQYKHVVVCGSVCGLLNCTDGVNISNCFRRYRWEMFQHFHVGCF